MGLILDSSVLVAAERQGKNARQILSTIAAKTSETEIGISVVTLIELAHGAARADTAEGRFSLLVWNEQINKPGGKARWQDRRCLEHHEMLPIRSRPSVRF